MTTSKFLRGADIHNLQFVEFLSSKLFSLNNLTVSTKNIRCHKASHIDCILCRAIWWCVSQLKMLEIKDRAAKLHSCRQNVDSFVNTTPAYNLHSHYVACFSPEGKSDSHSL